MNDKIGFDLASIINLAINLLAGFGALAVFYFALKSDVRSIKEGEAAFRDQVKRDLDALRNQIQEMRTEEFVKKDEADRLLKEADTTHQRLEARIEVLQRDITSLRERQHELTGFLMNLGLRTNKRVEEQ